MSISVKRLRELRKNKGILQRQMAELLKVTERQYARYEAEGVDPPTSKALALAEFFNVTVEYLCDLSDDRTIHSPTLPSGEKPVAPDRKEEI
jgi:transcriptional regulator with XRE-family HTH domain